MKNNKLNPAIEAELAKQARIAVQAAALRLSISKQEKAAQEEITRIMQDLDLPAYDVATTVNKIPVTISLEMKSSVTSTVDIDLLTKMLTPEQFKQCAKVTLSAAKQVLPQALVDQCTVVNTSDPSLKLKVSKGMPVPEVKLFP